MVADALGETGDIGLELQIGPFRQDQLGKVGQAHQVFDDDDFAVVQIQMIGDEMAQRLRHGFAAFHMDDDAPAAALEQRFKQQHQVFGFFFYFHIAVAQDAEHAPAADAMAGKKLVEIQGDDFFQRNEADALLGVRQADKTAQLRRHRDQGRKTFAVAQVGQRQRNGETQIGNKGKRMRRVDRQRRQHWENLFGELGVEILAVGEIDFPARHHADAFLAQLPVQHRPNALLVGDQPPRRLIDLRQLLRRRQAVGAGGVHARLHHAHQAGHAHHVKFVEIGSGNGQEAQPFKQRMAAIFRFLDHPAIEGQPTELAIDKPCRAGGIEAGIISLVGQHDDIARG